MGSWQRAGSGTHLHSTRRQNCLSTAAAATAAGAGALLNLKPMYSVWPDGTLAVSPLLSKFFLSLHYNQLLYSFFNTLVF